MLLQLALDRLTREECLRTAKETEADVDWIEIGTGVIKEYGMSIVREMRKAFPGKTIVADMKICDAGKYEAFQAFEAGADIATVMAFAADRTISDALDAAKGCNKRIMVDLLGIRNPTRVFRLLELGTSLVCLHAGKDMQDEGVSATNLQSLVECMPGLDIAVAGGITLNTLPSVLEMRPKVIIVGNAITRAENPGAAAARIKEMIRRYEGDSSQDRRRGHYSIV